MRLKKSLVARLLLVCGGLCCGLLLTEAALRVLGIAYPLPYVPDVHVGSRLRPGFHAWFTKEGRAYVRINRAGFRDREHDLKKPANTFRIAVLGDSFAEAVQVADDDTFWSVLQRDLAAAPEFAGRQVEVLNFGISGHGTAQQLQMLRHHVLPYEPDVVLLAFFAGNDVRNNSRALEPDDTRPYFTLVDGDLQLDDRFLQSAVFSKANSTLTRAKVGAINASRVLQVVHEWKNRPRSRGKVVNQFEAGVDDRVFAEPVEPAWQAAWEVTDALIVQMNQEVRRHHARFVIAMVTQAIQLHPDAKVREAFAQQLDCPDLDYPERRIESLGREHGFEVIALARPMTEVAERDQRYFHGFPNTAPGTGHWNEAGHYLAGKLIAKAMCATDIPAQTTRPFRGGENSERNGIGFSSEKSESDTPEAWPAASR